MQNDSSQTNRRLAWDINVVTLLAQWCYMASQPSCSTTKRLIILERMGSPWKSAWTRPKRGGGPSPRSGWKSSGWFRAGELTARPQTVGCEESVLTLLGITSAVKVRTIRLATETPENVTRWLWIKRTRFVGNSAVGHRLESPGESGWCWMAPNTQWPQTSWMVSSSTSERPIFCQMHIGIKIWVKTKLFTCIQYYVKNVVR